MNRRDAEATQSPDRHDVSRMGASEACGRLHRGLLLV